MAESTSIPINDLRRRDAVDRERIGKAMAEVVESGYFIHGPKTCELEAALGRLLGNRGVVCVGNGTDALLLSLLTLGVSEGKKVATVSNAGGYATGAILRLGGIPILVDIESDTAQMSAGHLRVVLQAHPDVHTVVVTHLYGLMANMTEIMKVVKDFGCFVVEDCAQAIGAVQGGTMAGAWGDASTFSFYPTKNLSCLGDGGAVSFSHPDLAGRARSLAQYGWESRYAISIEYGFNSRLDEMQAAVLLARLPQLDALNNRRRNIAKQYACALDERRSVFFENSSNFVGHLAVMITETRGLDVQKLKNHGVSTGVHYPILDHQQEAWRRHFIGMTLPTSEKLVHNIVTLPCFPQLTDDEVLRVCEALHAL